MTIPQRRAGLAARLAENHSNLARSIRCALGGTAMADPLRASKGGPPMTQEIRHEHPLRPAS